MGQNVERAFVDLNNKYVRAKEVVAGFQFSENNLKQTVEALINRFTAEEEKYEDTKAKAEDNLAKAGDILADRQKVKAMEIARLTAQLRKAEMNVSSLQGEIEQKTQENMELTGMCDDLLAKLETST